ncbi:MAG: hypothetical protein WB789_05705 [Thermoplasmata archaeon]
MRESVGIWTGAILLTIGLSAVLFVGEWFAAFDACVANPVCAPPNSLSTLEGYLGLIIGGVGLAVCGAMIILIGWRTGSRPDVPENL